MKTEKNKKKMTAVQLQDVSASNEIVGTCESYLFDLSIDLEEITGTVSVMSQLGEMRRHDAMTGVVDIDDLCACLRLLEKQLKAVRESVLSALDGADHEHDRAPQSHGKKGA
ncbi:MAG: hypothetical protein GDA65_02725 [Nitrospira sp. CR1.1]|jgi:uncharacterized alpha/beta hydrolase family protein|nr:hypothetical protein [Nitrospira sp. CR1.1]